MPLTTTELHHKAQLCLDLLTKELSIDRVNVPESKEGYIGIELGAGIKYEGYRVYFHGFSESSWAHRYVIAKHFAAPFAAVYIKDDPRLAAETTALILRNLKERK